MLPLLAGLAGSQLITHPTAGLVEKRVSTVNLPATFRQPKCVFELGSSATVRG